jgi:hypothetical protein
MVLAVSNHLSDARERLLTWQSIVKGDIRINFIKFLEHVIFISFVSHFCKNTSVWSVIME